MNRPGRRPRGTGIRRAAAVRALCVTILVVAALGAATLLPAPTIAAVGPRAQAFSPPAGAPNMSTLTAPWVKFTTPIDTATLTADTFYLTPLGSSTKVPAALTYVPVNRAILTPTTPLTNGITYQATVTVGHQGRARQPTAVALGLDFHHSGGYAP